jgi:hypothetical protein
VDRPLAEQGMRSCRAQIMSAPNDRPRTDPAMSRWSRSRRPSAPRRSGGSVRIQQSALPVRPWTARKARAIRCPPLCRDPIGLFVMIHCLTSSVRRWSVVLIAAAVLAACSATQDFDLANAAIAHFRELMAAQQFDRIYSESADDLKKTTTEQNLTPACRHRSQARSGQERGKKRVGCELQVVRDLRDPQIQDTI